MCFSVIHSLTFTVVVVVVQRVGYRRLQDGLQGLYGGYIVVSMLNEMGSKLMKWGLHGASFTHLSTSYVSNVLLLHLTPRLYSPYMLPPLRDQSLLPHSVTCTYVTIIHINRKTRKGYEEYYRGW